MTAYVVFHPTDKGDGDCVNGSTFQIGDSDREIRPSDTQSIINKVVSFFPAVKNVTTTPKVGIRCGRSEMGIEAERKDQSMIVHCYGHGGSRYSASWGSANKVLEHCNNFVSESKAILRHRI
ncbi:FAD-dependent oxidoreductase [Rickettsiella endosymbiont of Xylota segnis]|uniref:FAD-dependent oxidoreductase n=1 Tax=Rickettsiella endosymbiont of Xylota segnis TaxID=3066238 RepID=UPI0030CCC844